MGISYHVGPAADVTAIATGRSTTEDEILLSTGFAAHGDYADLYDEDQLNEDYLDDLLYDFAYEYIPKTSGLPKCFSYYTDPMSRHVFVYADAEMMFAHGVGNQEAIAALKQALGDVEVGWLAAHSY